MNGQRFHQQRRIETKTEQFERNLIELIRGQLEEDKAFQMCCEVFLIRKCISNPRNAKMSNSVYDFVTTL